MGARQRKSFRDQSRGWEGIRIKHPCPLRATPSESLSNPTESKDRTSPGIRETEEVREEQRSHTLQRGHSAHSRPQINLQTHRLFVLDLISS